MIEASYSPFNKKLLNAGNMNKKVLHICVWITCGFYVMSVVIIILLSPYLGDFFAETEIIKNSNIKLNLTYTSE